MERTEPSNNGPRRLRQLQLAGFAVMFFVVAGVSVRSVASAAILFAFGIALWLVETRTQRPRRSFLRLALGSALLFFVLGVDAATWGGDSMLAAILWIGIVMGGVVWTVHYERTEPLI